MDTKSLRPFRLPLILICLATPLLLTACSKPSTPAAEEGPAATATTPPNGSAPVTSTDPIDAPQLAYDYDYTLNAEENRLRSLVQTHQNACLMAGPARCQVISSEIGDSSQNPYGDYHLSLRASSEWLKLFQDGLEAQLSSFGGKIVSQNISGEDLSPDMVDAKAHLANKTALRDRLQQVVRTHKGKIKDLIDAENQLSTIQGEIDGATAQLKMMEKRVVMSKVTLRYQPISITGARGTFLPLAHALDGIVPSFVTGLVLIIQLLAFLLPLSLIGIPLALWIRARKGRQKTGPDQA